MRILKSSILAFAFGMATQSMTAVAQTAAPQGLAAEVAGGRGLSVIVAQSEIKSDINASSISMATGGGLLGALIDAGVESARAKKAEELIGPIRKTLGSFDVDALAIETAKKSFADAVWFKANPVPKFSKDSSPVGKSAQLDKSTEAQTAFVEYIYDFSPSFDSVRIVMKYDVAKKEIPAAAKGKAEKRLSYRNLVDTKTAIAVVQFDTLGSNDKEANAKRLQADDGTMLRGALAQAFNAIDKITARSINLTPDDYKVMNDKTKKKISAGSFIGRPQPTDDGSTLIWDKTWRRLILIQNYNKWQK